LQAKAREKGVKRVLTEPRKRLLDVEGAAEFLGLHPETVRIKARSGELPGRKIGREWRFRPEDLDALFEEEVNETT
jgi:excisionase family DNA binding protein